jgi:hypothetical protein
MALPSKKASVGEREKTRRFISGVGIKDFVHRGKTHLCGR